MIKSLLTIISLVLLFCSGNIAECFYSSGASKGSGSVKYVYVVITYSKQELIPGEIINRPYGPPDIIASHYKTVKRQWVSSIEALKISGVKSKEKFLDKVESGFHSDHGNLKIIDGQCFDFKSYTEAIKDIEYRENKDVQAYTARLTDPVEGL
jgi:hypothetical protein